MEANIVEFHGQQLWTRGKIEYRGRTYIGLSAAKFKKRVCLFLDEKTANMAPIEMWSDLYRAYVGKYYGELFDDIKNNAEQRKALLMQRMMVSDPETLDEFLHRSRLEDAADAQGKYVFWFGRQAYRLNNLRAAYGKDGQRYRAATPVGNTAPDGSIYVRENGELSFEPATSEEVKKAGLKPIAAYIWREKLVVM
ncbi:MAG: hypothetical protein LBL34_02985 [Clostridiales bacterium]|jgi:hypothetical protein|nr:hypothetical protein [Clostridiales bacterium]